jgi:FdhD protein
MVKTQHFIQYLQYSENRGESLKGQIVVETPVTLTVNGDAWLSFMCTPLQLEALALGFLFNEGLIQCMDEVANVSICEHGDNIDVWLHHNVVQPVSWRRTSGCTGGITAVGIEVGSSTTISNKCFFLTPENIYHLIGLLFESQEMYKETGGIHTSALSDGEKILAVSEDIGRHNTLDKIAGLCLISDIWPKPRIVLTTGRISSEMLQKTARIGAPVIISRTSPSSLSVQMADQMGIMLIGYARSNQFNIYTHPEQIKIEAVVKSS